MTRHEKKRYLSQYLDIKEECLQLQEQSEELRSILESAKAQQLSDMPKGSPMFDKIGEGISRLEVHCEKYDELVNVYLIIENSINTLEEINLRNMMRLRYIEGHCMEAIAERLDVDRATVYRWHDKALDVIEIKKDPLR